MNNKTTLKINGAAVELTFDKHAYFRYGQQGGQLNLLLVSGQEFYQAMLLIWSALDGNARSELLTPAQLVEYFEPQDDALYEQLFPVLVAAGWLKAEAVEPKQ
jgi:hypothetical protein